MSSWSIEQKELELRFTWKISRGASDKKRLFFIKVCQGPHQAFGEVAAITSQSNKYQDLLKTFERFAEQKIFDLDKAMTFTMPPHLRFGVTSALTHLKAMQSHQSLWKFLNCSPPHPLATSFSLPILEADEVESFYLNQNLSRFKVLKIKIGKDKNFQSVLRLAKLFDGPIRIDANEAFKDHHEVLDFCQQISKLNIEFLEQPMPSNKPQEYRLLKPLSPYPVFADESLQDGDLSPSLSELFHGVNIKLMKAGSYQQALKQIKQARAMSMKIMLGCMVESSLGIAGAMSLSSAVDYFDLDSFMYFKADPMDYVDEFNGQLSLKSDFPI